MPASAVDLLKAAKARIADPALWGKGTIKNGQECAWLAIFSATNEMPIAVTMEERLTAQSEAVKMLQAVIGGRSMIEWNDRPERTHADVMTAFDLAIIIGEAEPDMVTP